jgi:FlaA1/EpsC-like NDP-sugar epimerase
MPVKKFLTHALLSRFLILILDISVSGISLFSAYLLRFNFNIPAQFLHYLPFTLIYVLAIRSASFYFFKTYAGLIKFTGEQDARVVLRSVSTSSFFLFIVYLLLRTYEMGDRLLFFYPISIIFIDYILLSFMLVIYRISIKMILEEIRSAKFGQAGPKKNIAIFGAGKSGILIKKAIEADKAGHYKMVAWFDDNPLIVAKVLEGQRIYHAEKDFAEVVKKRNIHSVILSMHNLESFRKQKFVADCLELKVGMMSSPGINDLMEGVFDIRRLKKFDIEDVLDRDPIVLDNKYLESQLAEKIILISGAAGSIGSEIVRQLTKFKPAKLILVDVAESPLVELGLQIQEEFGFADLEEVVADVSNKNRMEKIFSMYKPDIIYHAAAYKHVPIMEQMPNEAIRVNVLGTRTMADLAVQFGIERFVMISTDKAVNPTNVMGCSKRLAEIYIQSLNNSLKIKKTGPRFITTRFGNVLGSNGSVIPRFQKQIEAGGPITVTDPGITRFFMTIPEACQLVLEAGVMGQGGEIFIFDMGKPIKIIDLAEKMIKLSGMEPYKDIDIIFSGLRPGEKLEEELLAKKENILATHHPKIMKAKVIEYDFEEVKVKIEDLISILVQQDEFEIVAKMKSIVPEYVSNNSIFEQLDNQPGALEID